MTSRRLLLASLTLLGGCMASRPIEVFMLAPEPLPAVDVKEVRFLDGESPQGCEQVAKMSVEVTESAGLREAFAATAARRGANFVVLAPTETSSRLVAMNGMATTLESHTYHALALRCP